MKSARKQKGKTLRYLLAAVVAVLIAGSAVWLGITGFEGKSPEIEPEEEYKYISSREKIFVKFRDRQSGLSRVRITLSQGETEHVVFEEEFEKQAAAGKTEFRDVEAELSISGTGISDGEAVLETEAWDHSWRNGFSGNRNVRRQDVVIDTDPPGIEVLTRQHNVAQGGAGVIAYRLSEPCPRQGVAVDGEFFPGRSGYFDDSDVYIAFFGVSHDQENDAEMHLEAEDRAGNRARQEFPYYLRKKSFDSEVLEISDRFLENILPEFDAEDGFPEEKSQLDQFLFVNRDLRKKNNRDMLSVAGDTESSMYWDGAFGRLPNSAQKAGFADRRTYVYKGEEVDRQVHMGIDLASIRQAPVPAANAGKVAFTGRLGIYGNTVIIDHGFGLFSVYSHLSRADVAAGDMVEKAEIIGTSGTTGLAGGDHLHFGMFIDGLFVNPVEWWDSSWIENNVVSKLENVREMIGEDRNR